MTRGHARRGDRIEEAIEAVLQPGRFIAYGAAWSFVDSVEKVEAQIAKLVRTSPARAVALYETFIAGCYEKVEEIDDSSGSFGMFVEGLFCGWVQARQAAGSDPDETTR